MAKGKSTWKYNKLLTARRNYFLPGGQMYKMVKSSFDNKFRIGNDGKLTTQSGTDWGGIASAASAGIGAIGDMVNNIVSNDIDGKRDELISSVNSSQMRGINTASDSFDQLMSDYSTYNPLGHVTSSQLGAQSGGAVAGGVLSGAASGAAAGASFGPWGAAIGGAVGGLTSLFGSIGRNNKARNAARSVNAQIDYTNAFNERSLTNRAGNLVSSQMADLEANYAAFGGPLGFTGGAIDYTFMTDYLNTKRLEAEDRNDMKALPNSFAEGGGIHIKPSKRGTFTAAAKKRGMGVQEFASKVLANKEDYSPAMVKKANFARNFGGHRRDMGGYLEGREYEVDEQEYQRLKSLGYEIEVL